DLRGDIAFDGKNIDQLAIVSLRPKMRIVLGVDKSNIDANMVGRFLNRAFQDIGDAELLCDLGDVLGRTFESFRRSPRDDFKVADQRESGQDLLLNAVDKISVRLDFTQIFKRQACDRV